MVKMKSKKQYVKAEFPFGSIVVNLRGNDANITFFGNNGTFEQILFKGHTGERTYFAGDYNLSRVKANPVNEEPFNLSQRGREVDYLIHGLRNGTF